MPIDDIAPHLHSSKWAGGSGLGSDAMDFGNGQPIRSGALVERIGARVTSSVCASVARMARRCASRLCCRLPPTCSFSRAVGGACPTPLVKLAGRALGHLRTRSASATLSRRQSPSARRPHCCTTCRARARQTPCTWTLTRTKPALYRASASPGVCAKAQLCAATMCAAHADAISEAARSCAKARQTVVSCRRPAESSAKRATLPSCR